MFPGYVITPQYNIYIKIQKNQENHTIKKVETQLLISALVCLTYVYGEAKLILVFLLVACLLGHQFYAAVFRQIQNGVRAADYYSRGSQQSSQAWYNQTVKRYKLATVLHNVVGKCYLLNTSNIPFWYFECKGFCTFCRCRMSIFQMYSFKSTCLILFSFFKI